MNSLMNWYTCNYKAITWFLIGFMFFALLVDFSKGDWAECLVDIFIIAVNTYFVKK